MNDEVIRFIIHCSSLIVYPFLALPFLLDFLKQPIDALAFLFDAITHKMNLWCARKVEGKAQLLPNVRCSVTQSAERLPVFLFISGNGDENLRVPTVFGKANVGHGYHCKSWIFQFVPDNLGYLLTKNVCNSLWATHNSVLSFEFGVPGSNLTRNSEL
jgi:hypothetical protein